MSYEAWRITFQSSEQAARAAFAQVDEQAARIAALEAELKAAREQDPVAWMYDWQAPEGLIRDWATSNREEIPKHAINIRPLYASPVQAENKLTAGDGMLECEVKPRPLSYSLRDFHCAPSGSGPLAFTWKDKPHRLIYDLIAAVRHYGEEARQSIPAPAEQPLNARLLDAIKGLIDFIEIDSLKVDATALQIASAAIAAAEAPQAGPDGSLTLDKGDVEFLAARMRRLLAKFGVHEPEKDDRFIVGVAGSLIGNLLTSIELKEKAGPVRLASDQIDEAWVEHGLDDDAVYPFARDIEVRVLRLNGFPVEG